MARHSGILGPFWALCVGQSFRLLIGNTTPPPQMAVRFNLEWLWRIVLEPRRMLRRYVPSALGFMLSALGDLLRNRRAGLPRQSLHAAGVKAMAGGHHDT